MDAIKAIIIDDEKHCQEVLKIKLKICCPEVIVMDCCKNAVSGIRSIKQHHPDLIFLDVSMPGEDGFSLLEKLDDISFEIIFITAYDKYAVKAFECNALHFLLKPIKRDDLVKAIHRFKKRTSNTSTKQFKSLVTALNLKDRNADCVKPVKKETEYTQENLSHADQLFMYKVLYLINENYGRTSFGVNQLSTFLGMSRMQLYRKVRDLSHYTPSELLLKCRLDIAKKLLINEQDLKISDIAQKVGYGNTSNFTRAFKEYTGITPSEYTGDNKKMILR